MSSVVITGLGLVSPLGNSASEVTQRLRGGQHGFSPIDVDPALGCEVKLAGLVHGFDVSSADPEDWTWPEGYRIRLDQLRGLSPHGLYACCALDDALAQAGLESADLRDGQTGLYAASPGSSRRLRGLLNEVYAEGLAHISPLGMVGSVAGTLQFGLVARHGITGESCGFVSACASSGHALGYAMDAVATGRQKRVLVVAGEDINLDSVLGFAVMRVLSTSDDPRLVSTPFDVARSGFAVAGGAVAMVVESEEAAAARKAKPLARIRGWGQASDGYHVVIPHRDGRGIEAAMRAALRSSQIDPKTIDYINAHATSTPAGDPAELHALRAIFNPEASQPAISSTKALTGHALSAASLLEVALTVLAMRDGFTPGNPHLRSPCVEGEGLNLPTEPIEEAPKLALSNSSGFGGANVSIVLEAL